MPNYLSNRDEKPDVLSVSALTARIRGALEGRFPDVIVEGEIGNWSAAGSGHIYFSLKDERALISAVMWRSASARLRFDPREGDKVEARGHLSVFDKRGQYQLVVDSLKPRGAGELWAEFERVKEKLEREGLFAPERKRSLPRYPRLIGIVTSPSGAAVRDILNVSKRRAPSADILIWPARVQGEGAAGEIARGIRGLTDSFRPDVMIIGRGGGSLEDLWEFNDEGLARVIAESPVPVVSAVGHEVDFSISDFVADVRAATPSAAAELVTEGYAEVVQRLHNAIDRSERAVRGRLRETRRHVQGMLASHAIRKPELQLRDLQQRTDNACQRMEELLRGKLRDLRYRAEKATGSLEGHNPELILQKGYAIVRRAKSGKVLMNAGDLKKNLPVDLTLRDGNRRAVVTDDAADDLFM